MNLYPAMFKISRQSLPALQLIPDINEISAKNTQGTSLHQVNAEAKAILVHGSNILP